MPKWKIVSKGSLRVKVPVDLGAKKTVDAQEAVAAGLWDPAKDEVYQKYLKEEAKLRERIEKGKIAKMRQNY